MSMPSAAELSRVLEEARDIADATEQRLTSAHVLLAFFTIENGAGRLLTESGIDEDTLLDLVEGKLVEPEDALDELLLRAEQIAAGCGAQEILCLHLLVAMTRSRRALAQLLLEGTSVHLIDLRTKALAILTSAMPRWVAEAPIIEARSTISRRSERPKSAVSKLSWTPPLRPPPPPKKNGRPIKPGLVPHRSRLEQALLSSTPPVAAELPSEASEMPEDPAVHWLLSPKEYPWLTSLGRNLSAEAARGKLDELVARDKEITALIDILGKRRTNNPCLLGEPGVGKTAVVEGLALRLVRDPPTPALGRAIVIELDAGALLVGTHLRGSFSEKLQGLKEEVRRSRGRAIIFFDELHTLVGAGSSGDGALDAANELKAVLSRGEFPCIGATTFEEWKKHIEPDPALARRFHPVVVNEPSAIEAIDMLRRIALAYGEHHGVDFTKEAIEAAVKLSIRFIPDRHLPDKAIALLDLAGSRAARAGEIAVDRFRVAEIIAERTDIPIERILASDRARLLDLERHLAGEIVGHEAVLARVADVVRRNAAGFGTKRPQGSFLFLGPTGVGKTETAKALAKLLHGTEEAMIRFDLSEFGEAHSVARLVGAPPGYVGFDAGGQLTEAVKKRPAAVILFDEVEKAHHEVLQVFLQILDEGRLTDGRGRTVSFAESIVIMTSNLGSDLARSRAMGFSARDRAAARATLEASILDTAKREIAPELWARIEDRLVFLPLEAAEVRRIAARLAQASSDRLYKERGIRFELDDLAIDYLVQQGGYDAALGARPMRQILARLVEGPIAARILEGRLHADESVTVSVRPGGGLIFLVGEEQASLSQRPMSRTQLPRPVADD
ncbi:MAG: ATP-dependent Clp protease ATP-binding subunit [Myxococcota bacterium]